MVLSEATEFKNAGNHLICACLIGTLALIFTTDPGTDTDADTSPCRGIDGESNSEAESEPCPSLPPHTSFPGRVMCSPLTRAVQTALVACAGLPALGAGGLTLLRNLREIDKIGSVGMCVGSVCCLCVVLR